MSTFRTDQANIQPDDVSRTPPLRCGLAGIASCGRYQLEALILHEAFEIVAVADDDASALRHKSLPSSVCLESHDELARRTDLDLVIVASRADQRVRMAEWFLESGHDVLVIPPIGLTPEATSRVFSVAARSGRYCDVWLPRNQELDFQRALAVCRSREVGQLRRVQLTLRQLAPWMLPATSQPGHSSFAEPDEERQWGVLQSFGWHYFDQLLQLVSAPVQSITAHLRFAPMRFDETVGVGPATACDVAFYALVSSADGCLADLEIDLASSSVTNSGWFLQGERGGYNAGRQSITVADGEVYEVPVEVTTSDPHLDLAQRIRRRDFEQQNCLAKRQIAVAELIERVRTSACR